MDGGRNWCFLFHDAGLWNDRPSLISMTAGRRHFHTLGAFVFFVFSVFIVLIDYTVGLLEDIAFGCK